MEVLPPLLEVVPSGRLIEPGVRLYDGGNVTVFFLFHNLLLLSFAQQTHVFLGMFRYEWKHFLLVVSPTNPSLLPL
jgi:hypothetical protein